MKINWTRIMGGMQVFTSTVFGLLCILGIIYGWKFLNDLQQSADQALEIVEDALSTSQDLLSKANDVVDGVDAALIEIEGAVRDSSLVISDTSVTLVTISDTLATDVITVISGVDGGMDNAIATAKIIDAILSVVDDVDVLNLSGIKYNDDEPLSHALIDIDTGLDGLPPHLSAMVEGIQATNQNLLQIGTDAVDIAEEIEDAADAVETLSEPLDGYMTTVENSLEFIRDLRGKLVGIRQTAQWILVIVLGVVCLMQIPSVYIGYALATSETGKKYMERMQKSQSNALHKRS